MAATMTRRQWIRADLSGRGRIAPTPPWSTPRFHALCTRCDDCLAACPEKILVRGDGGFPAVDFARGECTFCGDCVAACRPGALRRPAPDAAPWSLVAAIGDACIEPAGTFCHACIDPCPEAAIRAPARPGRGLPQVDAAACSGCGACVAPCPAGAIRVAPPANHPTERACA